MPHTCIWCLKKMCTFVHSAPHTCAQLLPLSNLSFWNLEKQQSTFVPINKQRLLMYLCHLACVGTLIWSDYLWSLLVGPVWLVAWKNTLLSSCFKSLSSALLIGKSHRPNYKTNATQSGPSGLLCESAWCSVGGLLRYLGANIRCVGVSPHWEWCWLLTWNGMHK